MRLVSYDQTGKWKPGIVLGSAVFDVATLLGHDKVADEAEVHSIRELLQVFGNRLPHLYQRLTAAAEKKPNAEVGRVDKLRLGPPVTDPSKVLCIGLNYNDHVAETGRALPTHPDIFPKFASTLIGPSDDINCSEITPNLDFEGEMAVVVGRKCRHVSQENALDYVAGITVLNDITARDLTISGYPVAGGKGCGQLHPSGACNRYFG